MLRTLTRFPDYEAIYTEGDAYHTSHQVGEGHIPYTDRFYADGKLATQRLARLLGTLRLLDVGCANGAFVLRAHDMGFEADGLEPNVTMAAWAREKTGRPIYTTWAEVPTRYHILTLHDVFEHVVDPVAELARLRGYLYDGGRVVIDVPDADDPRRQLPDMAWHHYRPEQHLWHWTEATLRPVLQRQGFVVEAVERPIQGKLVTYARKSY